MKNLRALNQEFAEMKERMEGFEVLVLELTEMVATLSELLVAETESRAKDEPPEPPREVLDKICEAEGFGVDLGEPDPKPKKKSTKKLN